MPVSTVDQPYPSSHLAGLPAATNWAMARANRQALHAAKAIPPRDSRSSVAHSDATGNSEGGGRWFGRPPRPVQRTTTTENATAEQAPVSSDRSTGTAAGGIASDGEPPTGPLVDYQA